MERSSSTLVNVAEHAELRLVRLLSEGNSELESNCENCIANADAVGLIRAILQSEAFEKMLSLKDATSAFSILACLISRIPSLEEQSTMTMELATAIVVSSTGVSWNTQLDMLCSLYNLRPNGSDKCQLLQQIVSLAAKEQPSLLEPITPHSNISPTMEINNTAKTSVVDSNLSELLQPPVLERLVDSWGPSVSTKEQQDLYLLAANSLSQYPSVRQSYLLKVLKSSASIEIAKDAAIGAIHDPITLFTEQRNILSLPAIQSLFTQPETKPLYELLKIFQEDMLSDFEDFCNKYGANKVVELLGGSDDDSVVEQCRTNMRMLSLCSLASEQYYEEGEIPYPAIVSTLRISAEEVEPWVISAVSSGLLTAKMDQIQQVVLVERSVLRKFGPTQWAMLQNRLHAWKNNVAQVLQNLQQQQQQSDTMISATTQ